MRKRVDQLGVAQPEIQRSGEDEIDVALPDVTNATQAEGEVGKTAQLLLLRLGAERDRPDGQPAPTEATVTGDATSTGRRRGDGGLPEYQAVLRAAKRPPILRRTDTTWARGCTPQQVNGCIYGSWYLLDTEARKDALQAAREETEQQPLRRRLQAAGGREAEGGARQPRHGARAGATGRKRRRQGHQPSPEQLVRAQRRTRC